MSGQENTLELIPKYVEHMCNKKHFPRNSVTHHFVCTKNCCENLNFQSETIEI